MRANNNAELAETLRKINELWAKAHELADPILRRWQAEEKALAFGKRPSTLPGNAPTKQAA